MNLVGSDLRSSAALIIAGIIAKGSSNFYGLEHLDRGYENFELKLKNFQHPQILLKLKMKSLKNF